MLSVREVKPRGGSLRESMKKTLGTASLSLSRFLSINTQKEQFINLNFWQPEKIEETTALSLSGGGSKGSFQVGALHFFDESGLWNQFRITRIASSSVGSVNALKLAEGRKQSIRETLKIWMDLKFPSHMYDKTKSLKNVEAQLESGIFSILKNEIASGVQSPFFPLKIDGIRDDIGDLIRGGSIFTLKPTRDSLSKNVDFDKVKHSKIDLRLVASEQRTQRPVAFAKNGTLIRPRNVATPIPHTNWSLFETVRLKNIAGATSFKDRMLNAVEASAAIPGVFPVVAAIETKNGKDWTGFYVDGGVNDILPRRYAGSLNGIASPLSHEPVHFLSIFAGTVDVENEASPIEEQRVYRHKYALNNQGIEDMSKNPPLNFPSIRPSWRWRKDQIKPNLVENIAQGLFSALSEVSRGDLAEGQKENGESITMQPYQAVHGTVEVHPGKLRINTAYGYMSAFDRMLIAGGELSKREEHHLLKTSYEITRRRVLTIKRQELAIYKIVHFFLGTQEFGVQEYVNKFLAPIDEKPLQGLRALENNIFTYSSSVHNDLQRALFEKLLFSKIVPNNMIFEADTLKRIREDKKIIAELVISRVQHFGLGSVPINMDRSKNRERKRHNSVASWWTEFELSNRNTVFLARPLSERQQVGSITNSDLQMKKFLDRLSKEGLQAAITRNNFSEASRFLDRLLNDPQQVNSFMNITSEKDESFNISSRNLPADIVKALS